MIPSESKSCKHCKTEFKETEEYEIDPRLTIQAPKQQFGLPPRYTPVKGPTDEQKKRLFMIIVVVSIIAILI